MFSKKKLIRQCQWTCVCACACRVLFHCSLSTTTLNEPFVFHNVAAMAHKELPPPRPIIATTANSGRVCVCVCGVHERECFERKRERKRLAGVLGGGVLLFLSLFF